LMRDNLLLKKLLFRSPLGGDTLLLLLALD
jgi:hypothetical protein